MRAIYNHAVVHTTATADFYERTPKEQADWMTQHDGAPYPAFVAEEPDEAQIVGWASLSPYNHKPGYAPTAETTLYVHGDWRGVGVGGALLAVLVGEARRRGFTSLYASITADNDASIKLHARQDFIVVGTLRRVVRKFDRFHDVTLMQLMLNNDA